MQITSCLGPLVVLPFFGFLRVSEFTTNGPFDGSKHLTLADIAVDTTVNSFMIRLTIKSSKCDQFHQESAVYISQYSKLLAHILLHLRKSDLWLYVRQYCVFVATASGS